MLGDINRYQENRVFATLDIYDFKMCDYTRCSQRLRFKVKKT